MKAAIPHRSEPNGMLHLSDADRQALGLVVSVATDGELPEVALRYGRVRPTPGEETLVVSPVTGKVAHPPQVQLGNQVAAGAPLLEVVPVLGAGERISINVQGAQLQGQLESARHELATREAALERARVLAQSNIISQAKLQEAETAVATARANLEALQHARSVQTKGEAAPIVVRAPAPGTVVALNAIAGAGVQQGDLLVRLLAPGPRWVDVSVSPDEPTGEGYEVAIASTWIPGNLVARGAVLEDDGTRHDRVLIDGPENVDLVTGQVVSVRVARGGPRGIVLPESAVAPGVPSDLVFVEAAPNTFAGRPVQVAARFGGKVRLSSGISQGEKVVTEGVMALEGESRRSELRHVE